MTLKDLELGVKSFSKKQATPKIPQSSGRFFFFAKLGFFFAWLEEIAMSSDPAKIVLFDANGNVNLDRLEKILSDAFDEEPEVEIFGFTIRKNDLTELMQFLRGQNNASSVPNVNAGFNAGQVGGVK